MGEAYFCSVQCRLYASQSLFSLDLFDYETLPLFYKDIYSLMIFTDLALEPVVYIKVCLLSCSMAEVASTEQLPVKLGQEYQVKLGKSFTFPRENAYHTIRQN